MKVLKWICFIICCTDIVGYIITQGKNIEKEIRMSGKLARLVGLLVGVAARVFVLCGAVTNWLLV
jgi:hypothetical protein